MEYQKLNPEFKAKWLTALRSGEYQQGKNQLYNKINNSYCCLGVAAHICGIPNEKLYDAGYIPWEMSSTSPELEPLSRYNRKAINTLISHNDGVNINYINPLKDHWDFNQIADWIKKICKIMKQSFLRQSEIIELLNSNHMIEELHVPNYGTTSFTRPIKTGLKDKIYYSINNLPISFQTFRKMNRENLLLFDGGGRRGLCNFKNYKLR